jgi:DNA-binding MarR family transcriptional regulator
MSRKSTSASKEKVVRELIAEVSRTTALSAMLSQAVADRVGLASTDLKCLDMIAMSEGEASPGDLMRSTGLTSGAITGVIDRLEAAGFVRRERDAHDRRRIVLRLQPARLAEVGRYYSSLQGALTSLWSTYTVSELQLVLEFNRRSCEVSRLELERMSSMPRTGRRESATRPSTRSREPGKSG